MNLNNNPALFSLAEEDNCYLIAIDLPTMPAQSAEITVKKDELVVEGSEQTLFRLLPQGKNIKTVYKNGILWLMLPKLKIPSFEMAEAATA